MKLGDRVVYVGSDPIFRDLVGILIETEDRATRTRQWHFQPESDAIRPVPCLAEDVRAIQLSA